jgi:hypothetical protein
MKAPENTETNRVVLATKVIESWDWNDLYNYAHQQLEEEYKNQAYFASDWDVTMEE